MSIGEGSRHSDPKRGPDEDIVVRLGLIRKVPESAEPGDEPGSEQDYPVWTISSCDAGM